ncbi:predicted protein [Histoplasma mississippiense (nom. inval.)]|uniref:predicted protein n=1 Tax=Ajellomyces capsulatus (strain NAm1 / WU24) TaxID=2059318 RepID=UPI000157C8DC|nr:predicted protein [Histoplasma mississippiense (nom. inval.)]EDN08977.1 predicted protein [Histoplasma mississippiense (nom. inval.)]
MSAENSSSKASLFLDSPRKWNLWYTVILDLADELQVLDLISEESPHRMSEIPVPVPPEFPTEHTMEARVKWEMENSKYNNDRNLYKDKLAGADRQYEIRKKYQNLQKVPKQNLDQWLDAWTLIETEIKHSGIDGNFDIWEDFFLINMSIDNPYAATRKREVEIGGKENFSFADVVNDFRSEYRKKGYSKPGPLLSNLATFNGRQAGQSRSRTCVCGSKHSWVKCYYLNPSQRPEGWKENEQRQEQVYTGDSTTRVLEYGTVWTYMTNAAGKQFRVILRNAAYIPLSHTNLIAWKPCYHIGGIYLDGRTFRLRRISNDSIFARIEVYGGLLVTEYHRTSENTLVLANIAPPSNPAEPARISQSEPTKISKSSKSSTTPSYTAKSSTASSKIWHQRLGHPSMRAVEHLPIDAKGVQISDIKDIAKNIDIEDKELCEPCHLAKAKNQISRRPHIRSKLPFERLHADIVQGPSYCYNGERWLIHFDWVIELGLEIEYSSEYIHEQNGAAERAGAIITTRARALRIESLLPQSLFPEIATAAVYLLNRTPTKILGWKSPLRALEEYLHINHHSCAHLRAYGCRAYAKIPNEILNRNRSQKLDPRAHIEYLVEFLDIEVQEPRVGNPQQENNLCSDIDIFHPDEIPPRTESVDKDNEDINEALEAQLMADILPTPDPTSESDSNVSIESDFSIDTHPILSSSNQASRANEISSDFNESNIIEGKRTRKATHHIAVSIAKDNPNRMINAAFAEPLSRSEPLKIHRSQLPDPPQHWNDINKHPYRDEWINAAKREWDSITQQNTYEIVNRPSKDTSVIPLHWVFTYKFDDDGYLVKFKARICVRGDLQPVSDLDTKAHTLAARTFRILLAIINAFDLDAEQLNGVNAFVNSSLDELVYVELPDDGKP